MLQLFDLLEGGPKIIVYAHIPPIPSKAKIQLTPSPVKPGKNHVPQPPEFLSLSFLLRI